MPTPVTGDTLRAAMRRVPSPVTVVTAAAPEGRSAVGRGMTVGSFTSVSLEPPLISLNIHRDATMHDLVPAAGRFAVHVLAREQAHLAVHFAIPDRTGAEQFAAIPHRADAHGTPILEDVLIVLHCRLRDTVAAGDHTIFIGEVVGVQNERAGEPAMYYHSSYRQVGDEVPPEALAPADGASSEAAQPEGASEASAPVNRASSDAP